MTNSLKFILAACVIAFIVGSTDAGSALVWGILKPVSALLFGTFFIGQLLHKESLKFDEEQRALLAKAQTSTSSPEKKTARRGSDSRLATAH